MLKGMLFEIELFPERAYIEGAVVQWEDASFARTRWGFDSPRLHHLLFFMSRAATIDELQIRFLIQQLLDHACFCVNNWRRSLIF